MKEMKDRTTSATLVAVLLISLAATNAVWLLVNWQRGPLIALAFYLVVTYLCLRKGDFQAGVIAGTLGFGVHLLELFGPGSNQLTGIEQFFFYINLILPVPLAITSYLALRKGSDGIGNQRLS